MAIDYNQSSTDYNALEHEYGGAGVATYEPGYRLKGEKYRSVNYQYRGGDSYETHAITAAVTGSATATAAITEEAFITGAITGSATVTAVVVEEASITGAITGTATVTAATFEEKFLTGAISGTATATGAIVRERPVTAAITGTATVTAAVIEVAYVTGAITGTGTLNQPVLIRKVPQPELVVVISDIVGSSKQEEQQDTLELLVGV